MNRDDPRRIRVLTVHPEGRAWHGLVPSVGVRPRRPEPEADTSLPHEIRHVKLWRLPALESSEVRVLRRRDNPSSVLGCNRNALAPRRAVNMRHTSGTEASTPVRGQHLLPLAHSFDRLPRPVSHRDQRARN